MQKRKILATIGAALGIAVLSSTSAFAAPITHSAATVEPAAVSAPTDYSAWYPDTSTQQPPYSVAMKSAPGSPVSNCAATDDTHVMTPAQRTAAGDPASISYPVIEWEVNQNQGTATFDLVNSACGARWGLSASDPISVDSSAAAYVTAANGTLTVNIDAWNTQRSPGQSYGAWPAYIKRPDGSVISVGLFVNHTVQSASCFSGPSAPYGVPYSDTPPAPAPYSGTVKLGEAINVTLPELLQNTGWSDTFIVDALSNPLAASGKLMVNPDGSFAWTPTKAGTFTFQHTPGALNCVSGAIDGTITVTVPAVVTPTPLPAPTPAPKPVAATSPAPAPAPAPAAAPHLPVVSG